VLFLQDAKQFFNELLREIERVTNSQGAPDGYIHLAYWRCVRTTALDDPKASNPTTIEASLKKAADKGVKVKVILWDPGDLSAVGAMFGLKGMFQNVYRDNDRFRTAMNGYKGNIEVVLENYGPVGCSQHQKIAICSVDGEASAIISGENIKNDYWDDVGHAGNYKKDWHDTAVKIIGPATVAVEAEFSRRWNDHASTVAEGPTGTTKQPGGHQVDIAITDYENGQRKDIQNQLIAAIGRANKYIYLENQTVFDSALIEAIRNRCIQVPGLKVIIQIQKPARTVSSKRRRNAYSYLHYHSFVVLAHATCNRMKVNDPATGSPVWLTPDPTQLWTFIASDYVGTLGQMNNNNWLDDSKVVWGIHHSLIPLNTADFSDILEFDGGIRLYTAMRATGAGSGSNITMHSKLCLIDDEVGFIGSANFDYRSMLYDGEMDVIIRSAPKVIEIRQKIFGEFNMKDAATWHARAQANRVALDNAKLTPGQIVVYSLDLKDFVRTSPQASVASILDDRTWY